MKVLKFGGGCLKSAESIEHMLKLLKCYKNNMIIVVSAFDKLTSLLEEIHISKTKDLNPVIRFFRNIMNDLSFSESAVHSVLKDCIISGHSEAEILSVGELVSSKILSHYLTLRDTPNTWLNASTIITTLDQGVSASVNWPGTYSALKKSKMLVDEKIKWPILTQGFISGYSNKKQHKITCLGREGSDYSAAIFGNIVNAQEVILFKDVNGVYSNNPKVNSNAKFYPKLTYDEAIQFLKKSTYNTIIHPKTIYPLKEKKIPLIVKNFHKPQSRGTIIC